MLLAKWRSIAVEFKEEFKKKKKLELPQQSLANRMENWLKMTARKG